MSELNVAEICGGAGGMAIGLEAAGFTSAGIAEIDPDACATLRANRPGWKIHETDIRHLDGRRWAGVDMLAGGVPCQPFSIGGGQLGEDDERDLFPHAIRLAGEMRPRAVLFENVPGLAAAKFDAYRGRILAGLRDLGYRTRWKVLHSAGYGVPQLRPRFILVGFADAADAARFAWPEPSPCTDTAGSCLAGLMASGGWPGAGRWAAGAQAIAPTIVGGSKKHGGPDLGPTRARAAWHQLGVNGKGVADEPPGPDFPADGFPKLTVRMGARLQGFPDTWVITGRKTTAWRQVGNAFPAPVAEAAGRAVRAALLPA